MSRGLPAGDEEAGRNLIPAAGNGETNKERRDQIRHLEKEASQLANYYFVFQGVIFTAFYNTPSNFKCVYRWIPFALSFIAGFLNLCALTRIAFKYKSTLDAIDKSATRGSSSRSNTTAAAAAAAVAAAAGGGGGGDSIVVKCDRHWRSFYVVGVMCLFVVFFVITLIGCWMITCGGGAMGASAAAAPPSPATT
ncbi:hypothetical protein ABFS82_01G028200 [Erythranthe guttata]